MKNIFLLLTLLTGIVFTSFSQSNNLSFNLTKGKQYNIKQDVAQITTQTVNGKVQKIETNISSVMTFDIKETTNDFIMVDVSVKEMLFKMQSDEIFIEYDSKRGPVEGDMNGLLYSKLLGKKYTVLFDKKGRVMQVSGIVELISSTLESMNIKDELAKAQIKLKMEGMFGEKVIKGNLEVMTNIFPNKEVKLKDSWNNTVTLTSLMPVKYNNLWKFTSDNGSVVSIEGVSNITAVDKDKWKDVGGIPTKYDIDGNQTAVINVDSKTGWIISSNIESVIKGKVIMDKCVKLPVRMEVPVEIKTTTKYVNLDK